ncbi:hypothetical protein TNCV_1556611 [Trichonephila clavipes]|nr:hypothetical protein TNCV_1556611 [Trichonephila clavipes]
MYWFLNHENEIKSQVEMLGEYGGCSKILPIPSVGVAATRTLLYMILNCRAGLLHCSQDPNAYPERKVVPFVPGSSNTVRSLFCHEEQSDKQ